VEQINVNKMLDDMDEEDISSLLTHHHELIDLRKNISVLEDTVKNKIKAFLKERYWDKYNDADTKINVTISKQHKETFIKKELQMMLTEAQLAQATKITTFEKLIITTPEDRKRISQYVKGDKKL
jgi:hypothetical protein